MDSDDEPAFLQHGRRRQGMDSSDDEPALHYPGQRPREKTRETPAAAAGAGGGGNDGVLDLANAMTEQMVIPTEYSQQEVDKMMREKEREVKAQFQAEEDAIKKEINDINAKLDDSKIHDRRQQEVHTYKLVEVQICNIVFNLAFNEFFWI